MLLESYSNTVYKGNEALSAELFDFNVLVDKFFDLSRQLEIFACIFISRFTDLYFTLIIIFSAPYNRHSLGKFSTFVHTFLSGFFELSFFFCEHLLQIQLVLSQFFLTLKCDIDELVFLEKLLP